MKSLDQFRVAFKNGWKLAHQDPDATPGCKDKQSSLGRLEELRLGN